MEEQRSKADTVKLVVAVVLLMAAVAAFYSFADYPTIVRVLGLLAAVGVSVAIVAQTVVGRNAIGFAQEARTEVRKVVWPTRTETTQTTLIVFVMVIILGVVIWLLDMVLLKLVRLVTGQGA